MLPKQLVNSAVWKLQCHFFVGSKKKIYSLKQFSQMFAGMTKASISLLIELLMWLRCVFQSRAKTKLQRSGLQKNTGGQSIIFFLINSTVNYKEMNWFNKTDNSHEASIYSMNQVTNPCHMKCLRLSLVNQLHTGQRCSLCHINPLFSKSTGFMAKYNSN